MLLFHKIKRNERSNLVWFRLKIQFYKQVFAVQYGMGKYFRILLHMCSLSSVGTLILVWEVEHTNMLELLLNCSYCYYNLPSK